MFNFLQLLSYSNQIYNMDLTDISKHATNTTWLLSERGEHYKLLSFVSSQLQNETIFDIGTYEGNSALAMAYGNNKVISYDIMDVKTLKSFPPNIEFVIGDFREDSRLSSSPFIFIDVDPHDGDQEAEFHNFFIKSNYKGVTVWDDIHLNPAMQNWWDSVIESSVIKIDLTSVAHHSGTGMIIYK